MRRSGRAAVVVASAATAVAVLGVSTRTWVEAIVPEGVPGAGTVAVPGGSAAAVVPALALVALAAAGALTIAGRRTRVVVLVLTSGAGVGVVLGAVRVLSDPLAAARASLGAATGLAPGSVDDSGATVAATAWPYVATVLGLLVVALALGGLRARRRWDESARFEQPSPPADSGSAVGPVAAGPGQGATAEGRDDGTPDVDARDGWDALSRGDDPTRG